MKGASFPIVDHKECSRKMLLYTKRYFILIILEVFPNLFKSALVSVATTSTNFESTRRIITYLGTPCRYIVFINVHYHNVYAVISAYNCIYKADFNC